MAGGFLAIGSCISATTRNQVIAFIFTVVVCFLFLLAGFALVLEVFGPTYGPPAILACGVTYVLSLRLRIYKGQRMSADPDADETGGRDT